MLILYYMQSFYTDQQGQKKEIVDFVNVQAWGLLAEKASAGLKKAPAFLFTADLTQEAMKQRMAPKSTSRKSLQTGLNLLPSFRCRTRTLIRIRILIRAETFSSLARVSLSRSNP